MLTSFARAVNKCQFLFWPEQLSTQKNKMIDVSIASNETYVCTGNIWSISSFDTLMPENTSWFSFLSHFRSSNRCKSFVENYDSFAKNNFFQSRYSGYFLHINRNAVSLSFHFRVASSLYLDLASLATLICISNS